MSDAIVLDVADATPVRLDVGDADPIAREEIATLAGRVEAIEADYVTSEDVMGALGGEAPALVAGSSRALLGDAETASWMERTTAADGAALIEAVHGNTLRWNQLTPSIESASWRASTNTTASRDGGKITATVTEAGYGYRVGIVNATNTVKGVKGHKYLMSYYVLCDKAANFGCDALNSGSRVLSACTAGVRSRIAGIFEYPTYESIVPNVTTYLCSMTSMSVGDTFTIDSPQLYDLTSMFGSGNEPSTVAEFEALFPEPYYPYDSGSLLPVRMEGVETVGFNQWDEQWELGNINDADGENVTNNRRLRSKNYIPVFPDTDYYFRFDTTLYTGWFSVKLYDASKSFISTLSPNVNTVVHIPGGVQYIRFNTSDNWGGVPYTGGICINLSDPARNGTYEPHWSSQRTIPAATYFPQGMRSVGTVRDELTETQAITRVGAVDLGSLDWKSAGTSGRTETTGKFVSDVATSGKTNFSIPDIATDAPYTARNYYGGSSSAYDIDKSISIGYLSGSVLLIHDTDLANKSATEVKAALAGKTLYYPLATPTTTPIDPPLNLTYRAEHGGTERITHTEQSAPPVLSIAYGHTAEGIVQEAASAIAAQDGPKATTNHAVGSYLTMGGKLYRVTTAIATGEAITPGTNVMATTVMAEVLSLIQ